MKRKAYIVPALEVHTITIQQVICNSITKVEGVEDIAMGEEDLDPGKQRGANSRRRDVWYDEYEEEEQEFEECL